MTLKEQVFAQAALLAGELDCRQQDLLSILCAASTSTLTARLREGLTPEDCSRFRCFCQSVRSGGAEQH